MIKLGRPLRILARPASQLAAASLPFRENRFDAHSTIPE
jgi:hypothetical protein